MKEKTKALTIQSSQLHQINTAYNPTVQKVETALVLLQLNAWHFGWNVLKPPSHPCKTKKHSKDSNDSFPKQFKMKRNKNNKMLHYMSEATKYNSIIHQNLPLKIFLKYYH